MLGRRADGYHDIQSCFVPIDLCDTIDLTDRPDGQIVREGDLTGPVAADLAVRAAQALQARVARTARHAAAGGTRVPGATVRVEKRIPVGAGLGGGSSDAATTLIGLNRLWNLGLDRPALAELAGGLGADVPFFLGVGPAFVEGIGERCTPLALPPAWIVGVYPQVHVSTAEIFSDPKLTRDRKPTTIAGFSAAPGAIFAFGGNDLEHVVRRRFAAVDEALRLLQHCTVPGVSAARMSGSGSAVFCATADAQVAGELLARLRARLPAGWSAWSVATLAELPLAQW